MKSLFCNHDYHLVEERDEVIHGSQESKSMVSETMSYIFCPRCGKRRKVSQFQWSMIKKEQTIRMAYKK